MSLQSPSNASARKSKRRNLSIGKLSRQVSISKMSRSIGKLSRQASLPSSMQHSPRAHPTSPPTGDRGRRESKFKELWDNVQKRKAARAASLQELEKFDAMMNLKSSMTAQKSRRTTEKAFKIRRLSDRQGARERDDPATEQGVIERAETEEEDPIQRFHDFCDDELAREHAEPTAKEKREQVQKEQFEQIIAGMRLSPQPLEDRKYSNEYWVEHNQKIEKVSPKPKGGGALLHSTAKPPQVSGSRLFKPKDYSDLVPRPPSRIKYEESLKSYGSNFNSIFDPRPSLMKSNTLKDLKEQTFRKSISNLPLPKLLSQRSSPKAHSKSKSRLDTDQPEDLHLPVVLCANQVPLLPHNESSQGFYSNRSSTLRGRQASVEQGQPAHAAHWQQTLTLNPHLERSQSSCEASIVQSSHDRATADPLQHSSSLDATGSKRFCSRQTSQLLLQNAQSQYPNLQTEEKRAQWASL